MGYHTVDWKKNQTKMSRQGNEIVEMTKMWISQTYIKLLTLPLREGLSLSQWTSTLKRFTWAPKNESDQSFSFFMFFSTAICSPGYCLNGGICKPVGNTPTCICQPGYTGLRCEKPPRTVFLFVCLFVLLPISPLNFDLQLKICEKFKARCVWNDSGAIAVRKARLWILSKPKFLQACFLLD